MTKLRVSIGPLATEADRRTWRIRVFVSTWLSYVGFYFCRRPFSAAKSEIGHAMGVGTTTLAHIWAAYLVAYALGQFLASAMGTRLGPRVNVLLGMGLSVLATLAMGVTLSPLVMGGLVAVNGVAQATGWSGNVGTMAGWFHKHERGRVMGLWSTNFTVGALASTAVMGLVLGSKSLDWSWCFYVGAAVLTAVWVQFYILQRNRPEDVGLSPMDDPATPENEAFTPDRLPSGRFGLDSRAWTNLFLVAGFYFFSKFVRYAIWSWAPFFLERNYGFSSSHANLAATIFDVCGLPGVYVTGWVSDRYFKSRRSEVALIMMVGMTIAAGLLYASAHAGAPLFIVMLGVVGFTLYGPDALLSGAGAMDIGGRHRAAFAAAVISGFGSTGPVVQELLIGSMYDRGGGALGPVFGLLFGSAACAMVFCAVLVVRNRRGGNGI